MFVSLEIIFLDCISYVLIIIIWYMDICMLYVFLGDDDDDFDFDMSLVSKRWWMGKSGKVKKLGVNRFID